ncbi:hypothetical protein QP794_01720 [Paenibacillus sp. UMB7766-LJ446]|uniref:hypothetical protein n=1 Tax=Paenibacillus sp. UMB7766-LJ446 TaxID=3046313 RepID=UPI0025512E12|nr:hypothetical protein [Paenibacillus sp. UMB7766-LJ446]MDK8188800.1 hypothetical protein [Paenibacillus sp. UMB7766-LJ446]
MSTTEKNKLFINNLELAEVHPLLRNLDFTNTEGTIFLEEETAKPGASIVGDTIIAFTANVSGQSRNDLKNAVCLAQAAAMKKYDRFTDTENFFRFYTDVLSKIGFVIQGFDFTKQEISGSSFTVDKVVIDILRAYATNDEIALVEATLKALENLSDDNDIFKLFSTHSHSATNSNFLLGVASQADNGDVAFKIGAFMLNSEQNNKRFLWFSFSTSETNLFRSTQSVMLNEDIYSTVRSDIIGKLGDLAKSTVADLEI